MARQPKSTHRPTEASKAAIRYDWAEAAIHSDAAGTPRLPGPEGRRHLPSRNARTSRAKSAGLSRLEEWDALGMTARLTSPIAVSIPSRMRWNEAGDRSPAISSV